MVDKATDNKFKIIGLYITDYLARYHVREIAKLIKKSHVTLLPHLKALENDKILISKTIGKNRVYSLNLVNILTKSYIIILEIFKSINYLEEIFLIKKISMEIHKLNLRGTIILFGSYAKRTFKEDSDIDIFYIGNVTSAQINKIKNIGRIYGKTINLKKSAIENFESGIRKKDALIMEVINNHLILQNAEQFVDSFWRYYNEIRR